MTKALSRVPSVIIATVLKFRQKSFQWRPSVVSTQLQGRTSRTAPSGRFRSRCCTSTHTDCSGLVPVCSGPIRSTRDRPGLTPSVDSDLIHIHTYSFITQNDRTHLHKIKIQVKNTNKSSLVKTVIKQLIRVFEQHAVNKIPFAQPTGDNT